MMASPYEKWSKRELVARVEEFDKIAGRVVREYTLWAEDASDGEFNIWSRDRFIVSLIELRMLVER
jgi:hypothetical protein